MIDWTGKMWHIYTMEYYAATKNDEFVPFVGSWMNLETIILSNLTQEQKIKHQMSSLICGCWTMWTHGHREGSIIHWDPLGRTRDGTAGGRELGRDNMGINTGYRWQGWRQQTTLPCMYLCNNPACSAYVPQNLKCNIIYIYIKYIIYRIFSIKLLELFIYIQVINLLSDG